MGEITAAVTIGLALLLLGGFVFYLILAEKAHTARELRRIELVSARLGVQVVAIDTAWVDGRRRETYITASAPLAPPVNEREPTPGSTEYDAPQEPVPELVAPQAQVDAWVKQEPGLERVRAMLVTMWRRGDDVSLDTPGHRDMWNLCRAAERGGE